LDEDRLNFGAYGILIVFGAFVLLLILNPNLSCFGKRIKSPLYPLLRRRRPSARKRPQTEDYKFDLGGRKAPSSRTPAKRTPGNKKIVTEDYGFHLQEKETDGPSPAASGGSHEGGKD
jgi:hypothetical protein